ncbi:MAG: hypothetical protein QOI31_402 [Solirubrobacterales bacterium]|jgi:hypothetical protein|nr:hypothetical protein [Solirubrobacterales bacterium]
MPSLKRSKPKTVTDRVKAAGSVAGDAAQTVGNAAQAAGEVVVEGAKTARDRVVTTTKGAPSGLETTRGKAVAAVGAAGAAAGAVAFWKKSQGDEPDVVVDPGETEPTSVVTTETPEAKAAKASAGGGSS